jgi:hypothetical protein
MAAAPRDGRIPGAPSRGGKAIPQRFVAGDEPAPSESNNWVETFRCDANTLNSEALVCCKMDEDIAKRLAFGIALLCVRNTCIEDVHAGIEPSSRTGDFSDVKVVTPCGEIPWDKLSRIRNDEMRAFMIEVVDRLYTVLLRLDDPEFVTRMEKYARRSTAAWNEPRNLTDWFTGKWSK